MYLPGGAEREDGLTAGRAGVDGYLTRYGMCRYLGFNRNSESHVLAEDEVCVTQYFALTRWRHKQRHLRRRQWHPIDLNNTYQ
jgi:hypothetical protein